MVTYAKRDQWGETWHLIIEQSDFYHVRKKCGICSKIRRKRIKKIPFIFNSHFLFNKTSIRDFIPWDFLETFLKKNPDIDCEIPILGVEKMIVLSKKHEVRLGEVFKTFVTKGITAFIKVSEELIGEGYKSIIGGFQAMRTFEGIWGHPHIYVIGFPDTRIFGQFEQLIKLCREKAYEKETIMRVDNNMLIINFNHASQCKIENILTKDEAKIIEKNHAKMFILIRNSAIRNNMIIKLESPPDSEYTWPLSLLSAVGIPYKCREVYE